MTIPNDGKIIPNRFPHKCHACTVFVGVGDGAAILDPNLGVMWRTYHTACLPAPYEEADMKAGFVPANRYNGPRKKPVTPGHERCAQCSHWRVDHDPLGCKGHFVGAPGTQCPCLGFTLPGQPVNIAAALAPVPPTTQVLPVATTSTATLPYTPPTPKPVLVVFYGPIRSASDGEEHYIHSSTVLALHNMTREIEKHLRVEAVSPEQKIAWTPPPADYFVIGPRYSKDEYDEATKALAAWLAQKGIGA